MTEANGEDRIVYAAVFVYRFWLLAQRNPADHARATFLMTGDTDDLRGNGIANEVTDIIQNDFGVGIGLDDVCRYMGIKRTNANRRQTREQYGTVLYPVYPLINSYCYSNTRCDVADDLTMEVRAQVKIREGEEVRTICNTYIHNYGILRRLFEPTDYHALCVGYELPASPARPALAQLALRLPLPALPRPHRVQHLLQRGQMCLLPQRLPPPPLAHRAGQPVGMRQLRTKGRSQRYMRQTRIARGEDEGRVRRR